eukprot:596402-Alexandrium_andersonii.AAC.1
MSTHPSTYLQDGRMQYPHARADSSLFFPSENGRRSLKTPGDLGKEPCRAMGFLHSGHMENMEQGL